MSDDQFCTLPSGIDICYRVDGEAGEPLLLIGGIGVDLVSWPDAFISALVDNGFRVIRFDNRDSGRSTTVAAPAPHPLRLMTRRLRTVAYDLGDMATDAIGLLDHLGIERGHLAGMSMGGMIAQTMAARYPARVLTLTSIFSTTGHRRVGQPALSTMLLLARPPARTAEGRIEHTVALARRIASHGFPFDAEETRRRVVASAARVGDEDAHARLMRQIAAIVASGDRTSELRNVLAPTAVIHGDRDLMVHPSGGVATKHAITGARLHVIQGMGHDLERPVVARIVDIMRRHADGWPRLATDSNPGVPR
ncbi:alpha/beta fold hydrolase [Nocardia beijingensis]|uniref:alpha/beta fold hydrolase n=1 Tax=Nocardia beijingensis TaxID=95162 RepID=UPI00344CDB81